MHVPLLKRCCEHVRGSCLRSPGANDHHHCVKSRNVFPDLPHSHLHPHRLHHHSLHHRIRPRPLRLLHYRGCLRYDSPGYRLRHPHLPHRCIHRYRLRPDHFLHGFRTYGRDFHCYHPRLLPDHHLHHIPCQPHGHLHIHHNDPGCLVPVLVHSRGLSHGHCEVHCWNLVFCCLWLP